MKTEIKLDEMTTRLLKIISNGKPSKKVVLSVAKKFDQRLRATLSGRAAS